MATDSQSNSSQPPGCFPFAVQPPFDFDLLVQAPSGLIVNGQSAESSNLSVSDSTELTVSPWLALTGSHEKFEPGSVLEGRYQLESLIAQGGMGAVYKARHVILQKTVAIKILQREFARHKGLVSRFEQEAKAAGSLDHPGLVAVCDYGITEGGAPFLVMEYAAGQSLAELIRLEKVIEPRRALNLFLQVCDALSYAHRHGVIHRDIKPANILISKGENEAETIKIVDFGIAKVTTPQHRQTLTQTGEIFGSPLYMSPEQCLATEIDARSDIYSLGCVMFEALSGKPPLCGDSPMQTLFKHIQEAPSFVHFRKLHIPAPFETVVERTLQKDPAARFQTVDDLRDHLLRVRAGAWLCLDRLKRWFRIAHVRNRLVIYPIALLVGCWLGATAGLLHSLELYSVGGLFKMPAWRILLDEGNAQFRMGNTDVAEFLYLKAAKEAAATRNGNANAVVRISLGDLYMSVSRSENERSFRLLAIKCFAQAAEGAHDTQLIADANERLGDAWFELQRYSKAESVYLYALKMREKLNCAHSATPELMIKIGKTYLAAGKIPLALDILTKVNTMQLRSRCSDPGLATSFALLAECYAAQNNMRKATFYIRQAIDERNKIQGEHNDRLAALLKERERHLYEHK